MSPQALPFLGEALTVEASKVNVSAPSNELIFETHDAETNENKFIAIFLAACWFSGRCEHC